jgi:lipopolysaccharide export system protein LptA
VSATAKGRRRGRLLLVLCCALWGLGGAQAEGSLVDAPPVRASGQPRVTVTRGERTIEVVQGTAGSDGARTVLANRNCETGVLSNIFYGPVAAFVQTLIDDTSLRSQIAIVRIPQGGAGEGDETVELLGGAIQFDRPGCIENLDPVGALPIELRQGRTTISGSRFFLDRGTDVAEMLGPIDLERTPTYANQAPLRATATTMTYDLERELSTLVGKVVVTSETRVSEADRLELDELAGVAILTGSPAVSRRGEDEIRGRTLRYDLDTDEVVAIGAVSGSFVIDLRGE